MKKTKKFLMTFLCMVAVLMVVALVTKVMLQIFHTTVYADVGSFEDYSSGSDWGGSSWDSGSSWSSSDYRKFMG